MCKNMKNFYYYYKKKQNYLLMASYINFDYNFTLKNINKI